MLATYLETFGWKSHSLIVTSFRNRPAMNNIVSLRGGTSRSRRGNPFPFVCFVLFSILNIPTADRFPKGLSGRRETGSLWETLRSEPSFVFFPIYAAACSEDQRAFRSQRNGGPLGNSAFETFICLFPVHAAACSEDQRAFRSPFGNLRMVILFVKAKPSGSHLLVKAKSSGSHPLVKAKPSGGHPLEKLKPSVGHLLC